MKAFLILEDGHVFTGTSIGAKKEVISEIVFNTSMTGYLEVLTDPSYAGQAVCMTYPLIGNYGICYEDTESLRPWPDGYIVRELSRTPSNFRCEDTIQNFLKRFDIPGIAGIDTRALTRILREKGTMNGMITTDERQRKESSPSGSGCKKQYRKISESERMRGNHLSGIHHSRRDPGCKPGRYHALQRPWRPEGVYGSDQRDP